MDRFVIREPRVGADYPQQGNQMMPFPNNRNIVPDTMYFGGYGAEFPVQRSPGFMAVTHVNPPHFAPNISGPNQQMMSGIDPRYLAAYADNSASYISGHNNMQQMERDQTLVHPNSDYQNRAFIGADRNTRNTFSPRVTTNSNVTISSREPSSTPNLQMKNISKNHQDYQQLPTTTATHQTLTKTAVKENDEQKTSIQFPVALKTRAERLRDLHKTGARAFSGPVEKVLKWHKALQELGLLVLYEVVAKCVSVRQGESCAKTLVVRDDNGPAMQVVYYEIDFLLPEIKPPCTVRIIGRMMPGTCRLQAFSVRQATGDDVSTLPRRAAVATHHVSKLCATRFGPVPAVPIQSEPGTIAMSPVHRAGGCFSPLPDIPSSQVPCLPPPLPHSSTSVLRRISTMENY